MLIGEEGMLKFWNWINCLGMLTMTLKNCVTLIKIVLFPIK